MTAAVHVSAAHTGAVGTAYAGFIERRLGLRLSPHQRDQIGPLASELAAHTGHHGALDLLRRLERSEDGGLLESLAERVVVGETHFFRVGAQIDALRDTVLPDIIARRASERRMRIWSAGCATGEEPYTIAILLRDALPAIDAWEIDLVGSDINPRFMAAARAGVYGEWSFRDTPAGMRARHFTRESKDGVERWRLKDGVRRMVRFCELNLARPSLPGGWSTGTQLDLIVCRNVTIYFAEQAARDLYDRFAAALAPGGWLLLGPSDPAPALPTQLETVCLPGVVLWRRATRREESPARANRPPLKVTRVAPASGVSLLRREAGRRQTKSPDATPADTPARTPAPLEAQVEAAAEPLLTAGLEALERGDLTQALANLRRAAFVSPSDALAHVALGRVHAALGRTRRAVAALRHARELVVGLDANAPVTPHSGVRVGELLVAVGALLGKLEAPV
jgi:chemotaxis protein methyltransferase CheR